MRIEVRLVVRICELAGIKGRQRECFERLCQDRSVEDVGKELGISPQTVYSHLRRAKWKVRRIQAGHGELRQWWELILEECIPNGQNPAPATPRFERNDYGVMERVKVQGARPLTVDDLVAPFEVEVR
jgi:hypothetical protein